MLNADWLTLSSGGAKLYVLNIVSVHLRDSRAKYDSGEDWVCEKILEYVSLSVNFPRINFIKYLHPNKSVENNCKMLRRRST